MGAAVRGRADPARPAPGRGRPRHGGAADRQPVSTRPTTTTSSGSSSARRATRSTSRSWSAPSWAAAGACPRTWPTCCSSGSTGSTSRRARRRAGGLGSRPAGVARPARPGRPGHRGPARRRRCARRSTPTCWCGRATPSTPSGTPCSVRRCTTTCCPASGCACTRRTPRRCASSAAREEPRTWPGTRSPPTTCPPPCRPASTPGEQALATGGPDEAARHFTKALEIYDRAAGQLDDPPERGRAGGPDGGRAVRLRVVRRRRCRWWTPTSTRLPADAPPLSRARLLLARAEAMRLDRGRLRPRAGHGHGARAGRPRADAGCARGSSRCTRTCRSGRTTSTRRAASADEALELADELGLPRLAADVGMTLTCSASTSTSARAAAPSSSGSSRTPRSRGDVISELRGYARTGGIEYDYGALAEAQEAYSSAARLAREIGRPWTMTGISGRMQAAVMAYMRGRLGRGPRDRRPHRRGPAADAARDARGGRCSPWRPAAARSRPWPGCRRCASAGTARG